MNNNRNMNNNNRRRGRNSNRPQGGGGSGGGNQMNRIDSRARGNAPQLLDKYKKLAQDAQHNGDRVQQETFLQYADHYFRVINDNKIRQDEARAKRDDQSDGQNDSQSSNAGDGQNQRNDDDSRRPRRPRARQDEGDTRDGGRNADRDDDDDRGDQARGGRSRSVNGRSHGSDDDGRAKGSEADHDNSDSADDFDRAPAPKARAKPVRTPRKPRAPKPVADDQGEIDIAALPPAIGKSSDDAPVKKSGLRPRRKRADDSETVG